MSVLALVWSQPPRLPERLPTALSLSPSPRCLTTHTHTCTLSSSRQLPPTVDLALVHAGGAAGAAATLHSPTGAYPLPWRAAAAGHLASMAGAMAEGGGAAAAAAVAVADLPLAPAAVLEALVSGPPARTDAHLALAPGATLHGLFEGAAARHPAAPCLVPASGGGALSYAAVASAVADLAARLAAGVLAPCASPPPPPIGEAGVPLVGLALDRTGGSGPGDAIIAMLAIMRAGAAYLPLDPAAPRERLAAIVTDARPAAVLVEDAASDLARGLAASTGVRVLTLAQVRAWAAPAKADVQAGTGVPHAESAAYVLFTSGSTGRPKGAILDHGAAVSYVAHTVADYRLSPADVCLLKTAFVFDVSVSEVFLALASGASLVIGPHGIGGDGGGLAALAVARAITVLHAVPSQLDLFVRALAASGGTAAAATPSALRLVIASGEALPTPVAVSFRTALPTASLADLYGPTEAAVHVTGQDAGLVPAGERMPIGRPLPGLRAYVVDAATLAPLPEGVAGELLISGRQLARGYLGRPDLTASTFIANPFYEPGRDPRAYARAYRTGDLARWVRPPGTRAGGLPHPPDALPVLDFLGRLDDQVKIRGLRIELGEVEAALVGAGVGITLAAAVVRPDRSGAAHLIACVEPAAVDMAALVAALAARLPPYMRPTAVVPMAELPRLPSGKIARRSLPGFEEACAAALAAEGGSVRTNPATPMEAAAQAAFAAVLGLVGSSAVPLDVAFARLGGTSLQAAAVAATLGRAVGGLHIPPALVLSASTAAALAAAVHGLLLGGPSPACPPLVATTTPASRAAGVPASLNQAQMVALHALAPDSPAYNVASVALFDGVAARPPGAAALERALVWLATRHGSLRTQFSVVEATGAPVQSIASPQAVLEAGVLSAVAVAPGGGEAALLAAARADAARPFQLVGGLPLFRVLLATDPATGGGALALTAHHAITDGASQGLLWAELGAVCGALARGASPPILPKLTLAYADFAAWQLARVADGSLALHLAYWKETLAGAPPLLELPTDKPRPPVASGAGGNVPFALSAHTAAALRDLAAQAEGTLFMALLAAFALALGRYARAEDVVIGTPAAGRDLPDLAGLVGYFVNPVALRTDLSGSPSFRDLLHRARKAVTGALTHVDAPFLSVVEAVGVAAGRRVATHLQHHACSPGRRLQCRPWPWARARPSRRSRSTWTPPHLTSPWTWRSGRTGPWPATSSFRPTCLSGPRWSALAPTWPCSSRAPWPRLTRRPRPYPSPRRTRSAPCWSTSTARTRPSRPTCARTSCLRPTPTGTRPPAACCTRAARSPTPPWTRPPTGWPTTWWAWAWGRTSPSACSWTGRPSW